MYSVNVEELRRILGGFRHDLGDFMSITGGVSVIVGPKSLMLSYCRWPILIVVLLTVLTLQHC